MNTYINTIYSKPASFGYDASSNMSWVDQGKTKAGILRPESTAGTRWHYAKQEAVRLGKAKSKTIKSKKISDAFTQGSQKAWTQFSLPPTSSKSVWYQGAIAFDALGIFFQKPSLRARAKTMIATGDNEKMSTRPLDIQNAAKNVYRKLAKFAEKEGLSSSDRNVKFVLDTVRNYAKASEIEFGKRLSAQSSSKISSVLDVRTDQQKQSAAVAQIREEIKDITVNKMPFKSRAEGNVFREWVNAKYPGYAKSIDLSLSGSHTNSFIQRAWNKHGQEFLNEPKPVSSKKSESVEIVKISDSPDFSEDINPFGDVEIKKPMIQLLEENPEEFIKQYWYVPVGGFAGVIGLSLIIRSLRG